MEINIGKCPACSSTKRTAVKDGMVYTCDHCGAIYGFCSLGDSYEFVLPYMAKSDVPPEQQQYFDFTCLSSKGLMRRHGWYDKVSKLITQVG